MRVLQTMAGAHHGGAEAFFERLTIGLQKARTIQQVVIRRDAERAKLLRDADVDVKELPFGGMFDLITKPSLRRIIRDFKPQVVLTWMNRATSFCPRGHFVHVARLGGYYDLKYYRACDHLIGNTRGIVDYIRLNGWPEYRVHYLPNFVDAKKAAPLPRANFSVPDDAPLAFALGRLHANKGFDVLFEALARAPKFHLLLAGEGPEKEALVKQARELGIEPRVHFLGWRKDIQALFATADVFVCPSRHEPLGNVVIEAWAAGVPVIAAASAGPRELIKNNENGILVTIESADELASAMQKLVTDKNLAAQLVAAGRKSFEDQFSETRVVAQYQQFFEKVAGR